MGRCAPVPVLKLARSPVLQLPIAATTMRSLTILALVGAAAGTTQLCPCDPSTPQRWSIETLDAPAFVKTAANTSECLAIPPGPPGWGPEGSGTIVEPVFLWPEAKAYQQWLVDGAAKRVLWPLNSSMCLTVLPPEPAPKALVGIWFCGQDGFEASQAFEAVAGDGPATYQLQLETAAGQALCVSLSGTC